MQILVPVYCAGCVGQIPLVSELAHMLVYQGQDITDPMAGDGLELGKVFSHSNLDSFNNACQSVGLGMKS